MKWINVDTQILVWRDKIPEGSSASITFSVQELRKCTTFCDRDRSQLTVSKKGEWLAHHDLKYSEQKVIEWAIRNDLYYSIEDLGRTILFAYVNNPLRKKKHAKM